MTIYLSRDYLSQNVTTSNRTYISSYLVALFLRRIMRYTYVGDTNYPINGTGTLVSTTIAVGSNGATLPQATINVASTTGFPPSGFISVVSSTGTQTVTYTGINATQFTGCAGGTGTLTTGNAVSAGSLLIATGDSTPTAATPTFNANTRAGISNNGAAIEVTIPSGVRVITAGDVGRILVLRSSLYPTRNSGTFLISALSGNNTTIAAASNGATLPQATINVASTTGFPASGTLTILSSNGAQTVTYTGTTATTFTGASGGTGTLSTGNPVTNTNRYVIDYRGNGDLSLPEANDTVAWYLYEKDIFCPGQGASNGTAGGYRGNGNSTTPRIILQSPHATGYQVRICNETAADVAPGNNQSSGWMTVVPGFGGDSLGDFPVGGQHLHNLLYLNLVGGSSDFKLGNGMGDPSGAGASFQFRYTMIGDDNGQTFSIFARRLTPASTPIDFLLTFGIPDNEPTPLPIGDIRRLFTVASTCGDGNASPANGISLYVGSGNTSTLIAGAAFWNAPMSCNPALLAYVTGNNQFAGPTNDAQAGDCPITSATELITVDLIAGVYPNYDHSATVLALPLYPRFMGTMPVIRHGRVNFGNFTLTSDAGSWTANAATNASPIQITTTATNTLVTGQTVTINGATGNTAANGTWVVTVLNNTQFTLNGSTGNGTFSGTASVLRGAAYQHMKNGVYIPWNGPSVVP